ncbi:hypothetical protein, partial [Paraburkholderia sp. SIMBA_053]|uniref:hypothetical protein n=1 Tax=Paraburkholderia sp. SIMBA_053 TaxID=3085794 RepID=UPI00397D9376
IQAGTTNSERRRALLLLVADLEKISTRAQRTPTAMTAAALFSRARNISGISKLSANFYHKPRSHKAHRFGN